MKNKEVFEQTFAEASAKVADGSNRAEEKRLILYCMLMQKQNELDKDVAANMIGYDVNLPSTVKVDGVALSRAELFGRMWAKAQSETRKQVMFAVLKKIFGVDFRPYKKQHAFVQAYSDACEREASDVKFIPSKKLAKVLGLIPGKAARVQKSVFEELLKARTGQDFPAKSAEYGVQYRKSLSKFAILRNERIEITYGDDIPIGDEDYL